MRTAAVRISQHDAFHRRIERRLAEDAGRDAQPLVEIDDAVADRRFVRECRRCGVNDGLRIEFSATDRSIHSTSRPQS
jgi:hypothetical protein